MQSHRKKIAFSSGKTLTFRALCREMGRPDVTLELDPEPYAEERLPLDFIQRLGLPDLPTNL